MITLWTPKEKIIEKIDENLYCAAGQLYSKDGINYLLRNILANPSIRQIVVCGHDISGSGRALLDFFQKGINEKYCVVGDDFALIHKEIPLEALGLVRQNVKIKDLTNNSNTEEIEKELKNYQPIGKSFSDPQEFPQHKSERNSIFPTDQSVFKIREKNIGPAWLRIINLVLRFGANNKTWYENSVKEIFNISAVIEEEDPINMKIFPYFQAGEKEIRNYQENMMKKEKGDEVYTYGERLFNYKGINQVDEVIIPYLKKYPNDRAALAVTFDLAQDHKASRAPCLCLVQATTLNENLNLTAYFRSHALFSGWVLNAFGLRKIQHYIAGQLSKKLGTLTIFSNCGHIYDNELPMAEEIIKNYYPKEYQAALDPRGYFVIKTEGKDMVASFYSPKGEFLEEFRQNGLEEKATSKLFHKLILAESVSEISHAFDLGAELEKAEIAIKRNLKYTQDKELIF